MFRSLGIFIAFAGLVFAAGCSSEGGEEGEIIVVPTDAKAEYRVIDVTGNADDVLTITTRREGSSGVSYSIREVKCNPLKFRYIGDSDSLDAAREQARSPNSEPFAELVDGSISDYFSKYACRAKR